MLSDLLIIDIETVPASPAFADLDPDWQSLFLDKIAKTVPEDADPEDIYRKKAGILAEFGKIICISTAFFYNRQEGGKGLKMKSIYGDDEVEILRNFTDLCTKMFQYHRNFQFGGHNIREFDIPYICRRMLIRGLALPEFLRLHDKKPWEVRMFDTLNWWKFGDNKNYVSLHLLANVLGIPSSKSDINGADVQDVYYKEGNLDRIVAYCQRDVVVTANIILRFQNLPLLTEDSIQLVKG
ncbi:MAG: ribonuclease H-like domain-containing protein [Bacteroidota bacterium]|nr:ribonuclease H-like domain-containing protein [Bacteroidota bacterium]